MTVNDCANAANITENCAICTISGLYNKTYSEFIYEMRRAEASFLGGVRSTVSQYFADFAASTRRVSVTVDNQAQLQVQGVEDFFRGTGMRNVATLGTLDRPLSINDLTPSLRNHPTGTMFAILIGKSEGGQYFKAGAHWIACYRDDGEPALRFVDYQLDCKTDDEQLLRWVPKSAPLGAPHVSDVPTRAWGNDMNPAEDRFIAISCTPPA